MTTLFNRRNFLSAGALGLATLGLTSCGAKASGFLPVTGGAAAEAEAARSLTGATVRRSLTAEATTLDLGGVRAKTWTYRGASATEAIRGNVGDMLSVTLQNDLPEETSLHWHGLALRNDADPLPQPVSR